MKIDLDGISLSDTFLSLFDYQGNLIQFNDDGGNGLNSSLEFTATYDGKYYASAASYGDFYTGNYSITSLLSEVVIDDYLDNSSTWKSYF